MSARVQSEFEPLLVSVKDATRITGVCKSTLYQLVRDGKLKPAKFNSKTLFSYAELRTFVESILAQRDADTEAVARSAEAKRRRLQQSANTQPQPDTQPSTQAHW